MTTRRGRVRRRVERLFFLLVWVAVMALIALGAAGIATGMDHQPGTDARPELTYTGDRAIEPELATALAKLREIATQLDQLGTEGRAAIALMAASRTDELNGSLADGTLLMGQIDQATQALTVRLLQAPGIGATSNLRVSARNLELLRKLLDATTLTRDLGKQWAAVTQSSVEATRLAGLLSRHDKLIVAAIEASISRKFKVAITRVDQAADALAGAASVRDRLHAAKGDVSELDEWLRRNRNYDAALRRLYVISARSPTRVTAELRSALAAERRARNELPKDRSGLVIIMADIGQGGVNQAVIAIERARDRVRAALAEIDAPSDSAQASGQR